MAEEPEKDTVSVTTTISKELHKKLLEEAEEGDRNISQQVKRIIRLHYENQDAREPMPTS